MSDQKKQIEEMAIIIAKQNCKPCGCENCDYAYEYGTKEESCEDYVSYRRMAEAFYNAGYRKQVEGECVEVVRCKGCAFWGGKDHDGVCIENGLATRMANDFCSRGKRKAVYEPVQHRDERTDRNV